MISLKTLIVEGRYDKLTNQISNILFRLFKDTHDKGNKDGKFELTVGPDDEDIHSDQFEFDLEGIVEITDNEYFVDGGANEGFDDRGNEITPLLSVKFKIPKNPKWSTISMDLKDVVRHELEHLTQGGENERPGKYMEDDQLLRDLIDADVLPKSQYFNLEKENQKLVQENMRLRSILFNKEYNQEVQIDSTKFDSTLITYKIIAARIIKNSYSNLDNYITINKGSKDGVIQDMGVITPDGILGIVENTSQNFSQVQSILNRKSNLNAKIKNTDNFGSLVWNTKDYNIVQLIDIPRRIPVKVGDTILTGAASSIFPENIPIGTIKGWNLDVSKSSYSIDIALFNDMSNIKNVYLVHNKDRAEIELLESQKPNGQ